MSNPLKDLPVPSFAWPIIIAFFASLPILGFVTTPADPTEPYLLGLTSHLFWGIFFGATLVASIVMFVLPPKQK